MVWDGKGGAAPDNPPTGGTSATKADYTVGKAVDLGSLEKVGPGAAYYINKEQIPQINLIITDCRQYNARSEYKSSNNTITRVYHWQDADARSIRGVAYSSVIFVGVAGAELLRSRPDVLQAIKNACVTHNTQILEV